MTTNNGEPKRVPRPTLPPVKLLVRPTGRPVRPTCPTADNGGGGFPFIVIRLMNAVYQAEKVSVRKGRALVSLGVQKSVLQHPEPVKADGQISDEARGLLIEAVLAAVNRTGLRMCLVWGPAWCSFVELDGSIKNSFEPPSGGLSLAVDLDLDRSGGLGPDISI